ncbi:MAG: Omp28 family outer membrane lipoprotein [Bacteroidales bacterium]|nr:Omp28 family outer membrane lipoprotein [Bacteroidales bacterium]
MKHTYKIFSLLALGATAALVACDSVDDNDRFIELPAVESSRVVLLEEFTGQKCINCPTAHETIEALQVQYPDNFIAVSIHSDNQGTGSIMEPAGLLNDDGAAYCSQFNVYTLPCGQVNRVSGLLDMDQWAAYIYNQTQIAATLDLSVSASLNDDLTEISINTDIDAYDNISGNLQLWVLEDGIVARQFLPDGSQNRSYVHNNVFRGAVNGINGESVSLTTREEYTFSNTMAVKDFWSTENLSVVAFVYNSTGVLQAAKTAVIINN